MDFAALAVFLAACLAVGIPASAHPGDEPDRTDPTAEALIHTPPGFKAEGLPSPPPSADRRATLRVVVTDADTGQPTPCRVNVVGPDGNYYEPRDNPLAPWSLQRLGNRRGKGPVRYYGWFFYTGGAFTVDVPPGESRVEVWKGYEHRPASAVARAAAGETRDVAVALRRTLPMADAGYVSGDTHLHFNRTSEAEEERLLDLLEAEDLRFGFLLCMNDPTSYAGDMARQEWPQARGFGPASVRRRGPVAIASGQEYRTNAFGHICLLMGGVLARAGGAFDPNAGPTFAEIAAETRAAGGIAVHAHGGYAKEIWADVPQGASDGVELLQFAVYRGVGLEGWYRLLGAGFRLPALGASDFPYCRTLGDARTYAQAGADADPAAWARAAADGRSFVTTGPMLLLEVDGRRPGGAIAKMGPGPHRVTARARVRCEVASVSRVELIVDGRVALTRAVPTGGGRETWFEIEQPLDLTGSSWIAARSVGASPAGGPDAEAHTNPVYVVVDGRAPYRKEDVDWLLSRLAGYTQEQEKRDFTGRGRVLEVLGKARETLEKIREAGGQPAAGDETKHQGTKGTKARPEGS